MYVTSLGFRVQGKSPLGNRELSLSSSDPVVLASAKGYVRVRGFVETSFCCLGSALKAFSKTPYSSSSARLAYALTFEIRDAHSLVRSSDLSCWCDFQYAFDVLRSRWMSYHSIMVGRNTTLTFDDRCPVVAYWDPDGYTHYGLCLLTRLNCDPHCSVYEQARRDEYELARQGYGTGETHWGALARGRIWVSASYPKDSLEKMLTVLDCCPDPPGPSVRRLPEDDETTTTTATDDGVPPKPEDHEDDEEPEGGEQEEEEEDTLSSLGPPSVVSYAGGGGRAVDYFATTY